MQNGDGTSYLFLTKHNTSIAWIGKSTEYIMSIEHFIETILPELNHLEALVKDNDSHAALSHQTGSRVKDAPSNEHHLGR